MRRRQWYFPEVSTAKADECERLGRIMFLEQLVPTIMRAHQSYNGLPDVSSLAGGGKLCEA